MPRLTLARRRGQAIHAKAATTGYGEGNCGLMLVSTVFDGHVRVFGRKCRNNCVVMRNPSALADVFLNVVLPPARASPRSHQTQTTKKPDSVALGMVMHETKCWLTC